MNSYNVLVREVERYTGAIVLQQSFKGTIGNLPIDNADKLKLADVIFGQYRGNLPKMFTFIPTSNPSMVLTFVG